ncbi:MAG: VWA domain-containing protein, partial [Myxococcales bacterium]|nr:VWA domain-containing protein [Myxococcales bacterium]
MLSRHRRLTVLLSLVGLVGCEDYLFDQVCPAGITEVVRTEPELRPTPADVLFVIDNSGSMREEQENLAQNFQAFINELSGDEGDYRIAVITTDATGTNQCGVAGRECRGNTNSTFATEFPFEFLTQQVMCEPYVPAASVSCFIPDSEGLRVISTTDLTPAEVVDSFQEIVNLGTCGAGRERGLDTMRLALGQLTGCNQGFLRDEANLVVVFVSDERGDSIDPDDKADGIDDEDLQAYVDALAEAKAGDIRRVRVAAIVGAVDGQASFCRTNQTPATDDRETAACGSLCQMIPEQLGSERSCGDSDDCDPGEFCTADAEPNDRRRCVDAVWRQFLSQIEQDNNTFACANCTYYGAPDCCIADPGDEYVAFANRVGALAAGGTGRVACRSEDRDLCLVDSICQERFDQTLARIARGARRGSHVPGWEPPA